MAGTVERVTGWVETLGREAELTLSNTAAQFNIGELCKDQLGNIYRYVLNNTADAIAIADGTCVYPTIVIGVVSPDFTGGNGLTGMVAGVGISAIAAGSYGWIQVDGIHPAVKTDAGVAAGEGLIGHTVNGEADTVDTTTAAEIPLVFGFALTADTTTEPHSAQVMLKCL